MKNKKFTYGLIVAVTALWIFILAKMLWPSQTNREDQMIPVKKEARHKTQISDEYELKILNKNPFKINYDATKTIPSSNKKSFHKKVPMKYLGFLSNPNRSTHYANISFDNRFFILKENDSIGGCKIKYIYKDSLLISFQGNTQYIHRTP